MGADIIKLRNASRPIRDDELLGTVAPTGLLIELSNKIDELQDSLAEERRYQRRTEELLTRLLSLFIEAEDEGRRRYALQKMQTVITRRASEYGLPSWFWRPDRERTTEEMLATRVRYLLHEARAGIQDVWAFLKEFNHEVSSEPVTNAHLKEIIREGRNVHCSP